MEARVNHLTGNVYSPSDPQEDVHLANLTVENDTAGHSLSKFDTTDAPNEINFSKMNTPSQVPENVD